MRARVIPAGVVLAIGALVAASITACVDSAYDPHSYEPPPIETNQPPVPGSPTAFTAVSMPVTFDLLEGASDPDGDALTVLSAYTDPVVVATGVVFHQVELQPDHHTVTVTPQFGFSGTIPIHFTVRDDQFYPVDGTATVTVGHTPMASGLSASVTTDVPYPLYLSASDADGDRLTFQVDSQPHHGTLTGTAPNVVYTSTLGYVGGDSFTYSVSDGHLTATSVVSLDVSKLKHAPVATAQSVDATEDTSADITLSGVDADGDVLGYQVTSSPVHGTLWGFAPNLIYVPAANYHGPDSFTFSVSDATFVSGSATVSINIASVNDVPSALPLSRSLNEDASLSLALSGSDGDGDALAFDITQQPQHGTLSGLPPTVTYTPAANYNGPDSFSYTVSDGVATSASATVSLSVTAVDDPPVAIAGSVTTSEDTPVEITFTASDIDSTALTFTLDSLPSDGTLTGSGAKRTYTPAPNANGLRSFTFRVSDGTLSSTATVTIAITPVNDAPKAVDDFAATDPGVPLEIQAISNDLDIDGDALAIGSAGTPAHGTVEIAGAELIYTPDVDFTGTDTFTYTIADPSGASSTASVAVGVGQYPQGAPTERLLALTLSRSDSRNAPSLSGDGRFVAFTTSAALAPGDTNAALDVYLFDRGTRTVSLVSASSSGGPANGVSRSPRISANGRYIAFESLASNLVPGDSNGAVDVFRHDRLTGETVRVSVTTSGGQASADSIDPTISDDGNVIAFASSAFDLVANDANGASDIFVRDLAATITARVSVSSTGGDADLASTGPAISGDGRFVAFASPATNLVAGDTNGVSDVFVRDLAGGATTRISVSSTGGEANQASSSASLSRDGRFVSFLSSATNLVAAASGMPQVYVRDTQGLTTLRPLSSSGVTWARLSSDGRYLAAQSGGGVSLTDRFTATTASPTGSPSWQWPSFSGNGRYVVVLDTSGGAGLVVAPNPL